METLIDSKSQAHRSGTNFYYSFSLLSREKRTALYSLYNLCRQLDDAVDHEVSIDRARESLQVWRQEVEHAYQGRPEHPLMREMLPHIEQYRLPKAYFMDLIDGIEMDVPPGRYKTFADLYPYCYRVASVVGLLSIEIFGYRRPETRDYAVKLGIALQLTNILRDLKADIQQGRLYLPMEELNSFGYSESDLREGRFNAAFKNLLQFQCQRAKGYYRDAIATLPDEDFGAMGAARAMGAIYRALLSRIERSNGSVFHGRVTLSTPRKLWIVFLSRISRPSGSHALS